MSKLPDKATRDDREKARENTVRLNRGLYEINSLDLLFAGVGTPRQQYKIDKQLVSLRQSGFKDVLLPGEHSIGDLTKCHLSS